MKKALLIVNIGTPESSEVSSVKSYLKKFLMDEDVITIPFFLRWPLVNLIIVPFRASKSAAKYKKIWTPKGSPLKVITENFTKELQSLLPDYFIKIGMTFSEPSIQDRFVEFKKNQIDELIICPMFPQYADATTGSILKNIQKAAEITNFQGKIKWIKPFYNQEFYIEELTQKCLTSTRDKKIDHWIFSFHGLPESQIKRYEGCDLNNTCCLSDKSCTTKCYRSQCLKTSLALAKKLNLSPDQYSMTFQSRLGAKKWLQPYTDEFIKHNSNKYKNIAIVCPAFVVDCLETLEEIDIENRELFKTSGGENFHYIPCLNADSEWISKFSQYVSNETHLSSL